MKKLIILMSFLLTTLVNVSFAQEGDEESNAPSRQLALTSFEMTEIVSLNYTANEPISMASPYLYTSTSSYSCNTELKETFLPVVNFAITSIKETRMPNQLWHSKNNTTLKFISIYKLNIDRPDIVSLLHKRQKHCVTV